MSSTISRPIDASFTSENYVIGAGVAIFHLATSRVVVCYLPSHDYWFLPKGRKNTNEDVRVAAEREGFEESGYRNRLLPLPHVHWQTDPDEGPVMYSTEAICVQLDAWKRQYLLHWYAAETIPPADEIAYAPGGLYKPPAPFPSDLTIEQRIKLDEGCLPVWHAGTGVNEEEASYESHLMSIDEAVSKLSHPTMVQVVKSAWAAIEMRKAMEKA